MTFSYKILGQKYYGSESYDTITVPGTSGYYTYTTSSTSKKYVMVSSQTDADVYNKFVYSDDGVSWTEGNMPSSQSWQAVAFGNGKFVAVSQSSTSDYNNGPIGTSNVAAYSTDGINWTQTTLPSSANWALITYGNGKFVAAAKNNAQIITSTDGINWSGNTLPMNWSVNWSSLVYGNGVFVLTAPDSTLYFYSTDGTTWTSSLVPNFSTVYQVAYGNGTFVGVGGSFIIYSTDGINWTRVNLGSSGFVVVAYGNGKFVILSYSQIGYSVDGINWTITNHNLDQSWSKMIYADGKFIAGTVNSIQMAYSIDGLTFNTVVMPVYGEWYGIAYGEITTLVETQVSIGSQGIPGSYVEVTTPQIAYTVPSGTEAIVSSVFVTNRDTVERTFDIAVVPSGESLQSKHHIRWDYPISGSDFVKIDSKLTLSAGDKIYVFPSTAEKVGFTIFGIEVS